MTDGNIRKASLDEIRTMDEKGRLQRDTDSPEGAYLGDEFWANAILEEPRRARSVHLRLDPEVFDYFVKATNGKGHLTRMQNVLKAYVKAQKAA